MTFKITARGLNARVPPAAPALLAGKPENGTVDAHAIQPFYTGLLARSGGLAVSIELEGDGVVIAARPAPHPVA
jgi:histidine phosphotransferase ChpT